jgi:two-component system cell cycle sensor histidine kinase/response regulator CckA
MLSEKSAHHILESLPEPHCVVNRELICVGVNTPFVALLGTTAEALVGKPVAHFWPDVERNPWADREFSAEFRARGGQTMICRICTFTGDILLIRVLSTFSSDRASEVFHGQRLETLGLLAGGVAHDFNNLLTGILGHLAYVRSVLPSDGSYSESLGAIEEGALRAASLTQQILKFSKVDSGSTTSRVDLGDVVSRTATLLKSAIPSVVRLSWAPPEKAVVVMASEAYLSQVVINLIVNARDAIKGSGSIAVRIDRRCESSEIEQIFGSEPPCPAYCALVVEDTGEGMDDEVKARLFEPYFTTKKEGGTGLGLSTVNSIVKELGGAIVVDSERGKGTTFRVVFPAVVDEVAREDAHDDDAAPVRGSGERVLIIDDEYAVRNVLGLSLSHLGYQVETASGGLEGVEKYAEAKGAFDLVILDMLMPGLSGEEVFARLRAMNPACRVLVVSGFSSEHVVSKILEQGGMDFIQKPFLIEVLSRKVRGCLCDKAL